MCTSLRFVRRCPRHAPGQQGYLYIRSPPTSRLQYAWHVHRTKPSDKQFAASIGKYFVVGIATLDWCLLHCKWNGDVSSAPAQNVFGVCLAEPSREISGPICYILYNQTRADYVKIVSTDTAAAERETWGRGKSRVLFAAVYFSENPRQKKCWIEANTARAMFQTCNVGTCAGYSTVTTLPVPDQTTAHTMSRTNCILC